MKYLKKFENNDMKFKIGDIVILIEIDDVNASLKMHFKVGDLYKIAYVDDEDDDTLPYRIVYLNNSEYSAWVESYKIRLAEPFEIDQNKYNL